MKRRSYDSYPCLVCHLVCVRVSKSQPVYIKGVYSLGGVGGLNILALMKILCIISILYIKVKPFLFLLLLSLQISEFQFSSNH